MQFFLFIHCQLKWRIDLAFIWGFPELSNRYMYWFCYLNISTTVHDVISLHILSLLMHYSYCNNNGNFMILKVLQYLSTQTRTNRARMKVSNHINNRRQLCYSHSLKQNLELLVTLEATRAFYILQYKARESGDN